MNPLTQSKNTTILPFLVALTLVWFALSPQARAVCQDACLTNSNTVQGDDALLSNTTGYSNTAIGFNALYSNTTGSLNNAIGDSALSSNTTGTENTAIGDFTMLKNITGTRNTAAGHNALSNYFSSFNTAFGYQALLGGNNGVGTGGNNTAVGYWALVGNQGGSNNTATGYQALFGSPDEFSDCSNNTADGANALLNNTTGSNNMADGFQALLNNTTGSFNIAVGFQAGMNLTTGGNNIEIGNQGVAGESDTVRIGTQETQTRTFIAGIAGATLSGRPVMINGNGRLGTAPSSARYKDEIKSMDAASEVILALKPVTFRYKKEIDADRAPQFGLVAEDVEKVSRDLVARDEQGKAYSVRYEAVNAMVLNEFLKEHRKVHDLEANAVRQQKQIEALTAGLQKVSAQVQASKPAPQLVNNP
jgi:trimeric autotransporter adhesin